MKSEINDIYSYTVFANIDDRKGNINGHIVLLSKKQAEAIESVVLSEKVRVKEDITYTIEDK